MLVKMVIFRINLVITTNPELINIFRDMELAIIRLMQKLGVIPEDVSNYMQQSTKQRV